MASSKIGSMAKHYDQHYFYAEKHGGKKWIDDSGKAREFGYYAGGAWNFQPFLEKLQNLLGRPESVLDVGAGCGGWVATLNANGIEALGLEFSKYALSHAILGAEPYLKLWDIEHAPWPIIHQYDWVTAIDLFEHLFESKVNLVIKECKRSANKYIIAKICTAQHPHEVWSAKRASYKKVLAQAKKEGYEWLVVSGHVNSQFPEYWREKFEDNEWKCRDDLAEKLKRDLRLPEDWRTTIILEKQEGKFEKPTNLKQYYDIYTKTSKAHTDNILAYGPKAPFGFPEPFPEQLERIKFIASHAEGLILDLGSDSGYILAKAGGQVGVDISRLRIKAAKHWYPKLAFVNSVAECLPFKDVFDTVIVAELLEHVLNPKAVLKEIRQVLKPNGKLIVTVPDEIHGKNLSNPEHLRKFTEGQLKNLLVEYFDFEELFYVGGNYPAYCVVCRKGELLW